MSGFQTHSNLLIFFFFFSLSLSGMHSYTLLNKTEWSKLIFINGCRYKAPENCSLDVWDVFGPDMNFTGCPLSACFTTFNLSVPFKERYICDLLCPNKTVEYSRGESTSRFVPEEGRRAPRSVDLNNIIKERSNLIDSLTMRSDIKASVLLKGVSITRHKDIFTLWVLLNSPSFKNVTYDNGCDPTTSRFSKFLSSNNNTFTLFLIDCDLQEGNVKLLRRWRNQTSSISVTRNHNLATCDGSKKLVERRWISNAPGKEVRALLVCSNGSISETNNYAARNSCLVVYEKSAYILCMKSNDDCSVNSVTYNTDSNRVKVATVVLEVGHNTSIVLKSDIQTITVHCSKVCVNQIPANKHVFVQCSSGKMLKFSSEDSPAAKCSPLKMELASGVVSSLCRLTHSPILLVVLVIWIIIGYAVCHIFCWFTIFSYNCIYYLFTKYKYTVGNEKIKCPYCEEKYDPLFNSDMHKDCEKNNCPYCQTGMKSGFPEHVSSCRFKEKKLTLRRIEMAARVNSLHHHRISYRSTNVSSCSYVLYVLVCTSIIGSILIQVEAAKEMSEDEYYTRNYMIGVDMEGITENHDTMVNCPHGCINGLNLCMCESNPSLRLRRLLGVSEFNHKNIGEQKIHAYHLGATFTPDVSSRVISLELNTQNIDGDKIRVFGNSLISLPARKGVGSVWEISSRDSDEKSRIIIGLMSIKQVYDTEFGFWTTNRVIQRGHEVKCTGTCSANCSCVDSTCKILELEEDRNWSCNPSNCLSINTGCTCCWLKAHPSSSGKLIGYWSTKYRQTESTICINYRDTNKCSTLTSSGSISLGEISLKVEEIKGITTMLPKKIASVTDYGVSGITMKGSTNIYLDPLILSSGTVQHGDLGDFSFLNIQDLEKIKSNTFAMQWNGVSISRNCEFAHSPTCMYQGVVEDLSSLIDSKIKSWDLLNATFSDCGSRINIRNSNPSLEIDVMPLRGGGTISIMLRVEGALLKKREIKPDLGMFEITKCSGCYNCHRAAFCLVKISLSTKSKYNVHLYSPDRNIAVMKNTVRVSQTLASYNITFFTPIGVSRVTLCLEEFPDRCASLESISLSHNENIYIPGDHTMIDVTDDSKSSGIELPSFTRVGNFFAEIFGMANYLISFWYYILLAICSLLIIWMMYKLRFFKFIKIVIFRRFFSSKVPRSGKVKL